jgi:hypothetical protein
MSYDLTFLSETPVDRRAIVEAVQNWATTTPHCSFSQHANQAQVLYENPDTLVLGMINVALDDSDADPDAPPPPAGLHETGCTANFNYLRPAFFANELTPLAAQLAKAINATIYDPQDDAVIDANAFERENPYLRHLNKINAAFARSEEVDHRPKQVDRTLLEAFWIQNFGKADLQAALGEAIFVPTMQLVEIAGQPQPTTMFVWGRAIPSVFRRSGYVVLLRESRGLWKKCQEYRLAPYDHFRRIASEVISPLSNHEDTYVVNDASQKKLETAFDRVFISLPRITDLKAAMPTRFGDFMGIVDAID